MGALTQLLGAFALVTGLTGCVLLDLLLGVPPEFDPDATLPPFPGPSSGASLTGGRATIELEAETRVLDELVDGQVDAEFGTKVTWTDGEGWYLTFSGFPGFEGIPGTSHISLDRVFGDRHWIVADPSRCVITEDDGVASGVAGTAACRGLRWSDYFDAGSSLGYPEPIEGEPAFDAEITFEAR